MQRQPALHLCTQLIPPQILILPPCNESGPPQLPVFTMKSMLVIIVVTIIYALSHQFGVSLSSPTINYKIRYAAYNFLIKKRKSCVA